MQATFDPFTATDAFDLDLLRELIQDDCLSELEYLPGEVSQADYAAYVSDMAAMPLDLPTDAEVLEMARSLGLDEVPF
jgi:hypothetical protein